MEFYQDPPQLGNQYLTDRLLLSHLERILPPEILREISPDLERFGAEVAGPILKLGEGAEAHLPEHVPYSPWGKRIDDIRVSPEWIALEKHSAREGLVSIAYERKQKEFSRLYQFAKLYLFHPSSAIYTCPLAMTDGAARIIELYGSPEMKARAYKFLTTRDPEKFWTSGQWMTEKTGGSDVSGTSTIAKLENGTYRLYGQKWFTSATTSQMAVTLARVDDKLTLFYLELRDEKGELQNIRINRLKDKLGTKALPTAELELTGTPAVMIGEPGKGVKTISGLLNITRLYNAICAVATMRRGLNLAIDYAERRTAFGKKLLEHGLHVKTLADLEVRFMGSFLLTFEALRLLGREEMKLATTEESATLRLLVPLAKLFTTKEGVAIASEILESFGGAGYIEDTHLPELLRNAQVLAIWEGTTNVLSLDVLRAIEKENAGEAFLSDLTKKLSRITLSEKQKVTTAVKTLGDHFKNANEENLVVGARELAFSLTRTYCAALLLEQAEWEMKNGKGDRVLIAARRWIDAGLVSLSAEDWKESLSLLKT